MKSRPIIVTKADHTKLQALLQEEKGYLRDDRAALKALAEKLSDAQIVGWGEVGADVITLNSRVDLLDLSNNEELSLTIVLPIEANASESKVSVLAPIGMGMLGYRVGDVFEQSTPRGDSRFKILRILYQPEAAQANGEMPPPVDVLHG